MRQSTKYVALDVHQATSVASVREAGGRVLARTILPTEATALVDFFGGMRGAIHVAFEEGTQAQWLHDLLVPMVDRVLVCDRRGTSQQGNKGDQVDADQLSDLLRRGGLRAVYHGSPHREVLKELARTSLNRVQDSTRVMLRLKALFRARGIRTPGPRVYHPQHHAAWLAQLPGGGVQFRAETLYAELDVLQALRPKAKGALLAEAKRDPAWAVLRTIPFLGPVRVALLLAMLQTPWRFRTKRHLWAYAGLAVVTRSSADYTLVDGQPVRRRRAPMTRGLNRNHNRVVKSVFKGAATAATARPGALQDFYHGLLARGMREELARVTLTRKLAALTLRLWKAGGRYDPSQVTTDARQ
ncbi:MAG: transposase [Gemmatimonadaceae bacterium]